MKYVQLFVETEQFEAEWDAMSEADRDRASRLRPVRRACRGRCPRRGHRARPPVTRDPRRPASDLGPRGRDAKITFYRSDFYGTYTKKLSHEAMRGRAAWSVGDRELMAAYVSKVNDSPFCSTHRPRFRPDRRRAPSKPSSYSASSRAKERSASTTSAPCSPPVSPTSRSRTRSPSASPSTRPTASPTPLASRCSARKASKRARNISSSGAIGSQRRSPDGASVWTAPVPGRRDPGRPRSWLTAAWRADRRRGAARWRSVELRPVRAVPRVRRWWRAGRAGTVWVRPRRRRLARGRHSRPGA
jgi:hypothetical protein